MVPERKRRFVQSGSLSSVMLRRVHLIEWTQTLSKPRQMREKAVLSWIGRRKFPSISDPNSALRPSGIS
jgi:hypothetical protein